MIGERRLTFEGCRDLLSGLLDALQRQLGEDLLAVALYGSVSRGQGGPTSDVDILLVYQGELDTVLQRFVKLLRDLRRGSAYGALREQGFFPDPSPVFFTRRQLEDHPWLLLDIAEDGIILFDRDGILRKELELVHERLESLGARKILLPNGTWYWDLKPDWKPGDVVGL